MRGSLNQSLLNLATLGPSDAGPKGKRPIINKLRLVSYSFHKNLTSSATVLFKIKKNRCKQILIVRTPVWIIFIVEVEIIQAFEESFVDLNRFAG